MTQRKDGPFPYKSPAPDPNPVLTAIARNPRPLIMMSVGLVGMLALVLFNTLGSAGDEQAPQPLDTATPPAVSQSATPAPAVSTETSGSVEPAAVAAPTAIPTTVTEAVPADPVVTETTVPKPAATELVTPAPFEGLTTPYIVLILDDIGNSAELGHRAMALPGAITYAILPHTPHAVELAEQAYSLGKEIMLHAPMSNQAHIPPGPGALTAQLNQEEFMQTLEDSISSIPHLQGVNNHMGSSLTEREKQMKWVMTALREHGLYFVDSLTTANSVAGRVAREQNIPTITRNVFLDNETTFESIDRQFQRLLALAEKNGSAVGIGHPYIETLQYLEQALPALAERNIELVPVSLMIARKKTESSQAPKQETTETETVTDAW